MLGRARFARGEALNGAFTTTLVGATVGGWLLYKSSTGTSISKEIRHKLPAAMLYLYCFADHH